MPPKVISANELIDMLAEPRVAEANMKALLPLLKDALKDIFAVFLEETLKPVKESITVLQKENVALRQRVCVAEGRLDDMESATRAESLVIKGLPEAASYSSRAAGMSTGGGDATGRTTSSSHDGQSVSQAAETAVVAFCHDELGIVITEKDLSTAYRINKGPHDATRPVVVRFATKKIRDRVFYSKRQLKPHDKSQRQVYFIAEQLTRNAASLFYEARTRVRDKKLAYAWTTGGIVQVKYSKTDAAEKPKAVRCIEDF
jgi:hypothetical protein